MAYLSKFVEGIYGVPDGPAGGAPSVEGSNRRLGVTEYFDIPRLKRSCLANHMSCSEKHCNELSLEDSRMCMKGKGSMVVFIGALPYGVASTTAVVNSGPVGVDIQLAELSEL